MSGELEYLLERTRIIEVISHLFIATDNRDREAVKACFTPTVSLETDLAANGHVRCVCRIQPTRPGTKSSHSAIRPPTRGLAR